MRTIALGKSAIRVSAVGLGGIQFSKISREQTERVIAAGLDLGINFIETASGYFDSEEKIGCALRGTREGVVLATKSTARDAKTFAEHIDRSLERLKTDVIDIYQFHGVDSVQDLRKCLGPSGPYGAAERAVRQGKIRSIGLTSHSLKICLRAVRMGSFDTIQYPISLINTEVERSGLLGRARRMKVGLIAMKPLGGGRLGNARLALGYIYRHPGIVPVVGVETPEQVRELARIAHRPPRMGVREYEVLKRIRREVGKTFCRACRYCEPCPQGISIFPCLYFPVYVSQMGAERILKKGVPDYLEQSEKCTGCRLCEQRCPFHLHVVEGLKDNLALARRLAGSMSKG